ncbi:hypothetical protein KDH_67260 [Dictyobacter sp. S3.2.2.5]|uniref:DUF2269 domain-containing protein n=1 Tax=Dictyobacter halimunensis TaxID=3026934 RepID=A0ABQ6G3T6_9CHLR|nr:hypothetical protein KDH_67260 [Dictyobacter sp. S3.2.2.5]
MELYPYALLLHIIGVLGLFIAMSLELIIVARLRGAQTTTQMREWMAISHVIGTVLPISAILILASGLFMALTTWGWNQAWIDLSLGILVILGILSPVINGPRMKAIQRAMEDAQDGPVPASLRKLTIDPVLQAYTLLPAIMALGAVALMVIKPDWLGSTVVMIIALGVGLIAGQLSLKASRRIRVAM